MQYVKKAKEQFAENEYSMEVKRVEDAAPYLAEGWEEATRGEWEVVQSDEVKARLAEGDPEFVDGAKSEAPSVVVVPEAPSEEVPEEKPEHAPVEEAAV